MERIKAVYWLIACIAINRLCSVVPNVVFDPFPFYDIEISLGYYIYAISQHLIVMVLFYLLGTNTPGKLADLMARLFWIEVLSLIDFFLIYEHAIFYIGSYGVEFTDIKLILYLYFIIRWSRQ